MLNSFQNFVWHKTWLDNLCICLYGNKNFKLFSIGTVLLAKLIVAF